MAIVTGGSGNWSSTTPNAPWPSGTLPTSSDDVTIAQDCVVTLDVSTAVCHSITLNNGAAGHVGGELTNTTGAALKLTIEQGITGALASGTASRNTTISLDMSTDASHTLELV